MLRRLCPRQTPRGIRATAARDWWSERRRLCLHRGGIPQPPPLLPQQQHQRQRPLPKQKRKPTMKRKRIIDPPRTRRRNSSRRRQGRLYLHHLPCRRRPVLLLPWMLRHNRSASVLDTPAHRRTFLPFPHHRKLMKLDDCFNGVRTRLWPCMPSYWWWS